MTRELPQMGCDRPSVMNPHKLAKRRPAKPARHKHRWVKPRSATWSCTKMVRGVVCAKRAVVRCDDQSCEENEDLTGRCAKHAPRPRKATAFGRWYIEGQKGK